MNLVDGIEAFVKIADLGSFAAAARELNKHNVLQEDRGIGKCMINRILWAVMN